MFTKRCLTVGLITGSIALLSACGDDSAKTASSNTSTADASSFSLAITDGPVDNATQVVVEITGVSIKPVDAEAIDVVFDEAKSINLLDLQGTVSEDLISSLPLTAGEYEWIRVQINALEDGVMDSFIEYKDGTVIELNIPSENAAGLKIARNFTIEEGEDAAFTIDFDLRKSVVHRFGHMVARLKPTMRMVRNKHAGHIRGEIDAAVVMDQCTDAATEDGAVYIFEGADAELTDVNGQEGGPIANALVEYKNDAYTYEVGFLPAGEYTVAYTCDAASDDPEAADDLLFAVLEPLTVEARKKRERHFRWGVRKHHWWHSCFDKNEDAAEESMEEGTEEAGADIVDENADVSMESDEPTTTDAEVSETEATEDGEKKSRGFKCSFDFDRHHDEDDAVEEGSAGDDASEEESSEDETSGDATSDDATISSDAV